MITPAENAIFPEMPALPKCSCVFGPEHRDNQECESCKAW
jgi:hypothetical protein